MAERRHGPRRAECGTCPVASGEFQCRDHLAMVTISKVGWGVLVSVGLMMVGLMVGTYVRVGDAQERLVELKVQNTHNAEELGHLRDRLAKVETVVLSKDFPCPQGTHTKGER